MNKVIIELKSVYGKENIYPVNDQAKLFASIAGTKTLSRSQLKTIAALGFTVELKAQEFSI